MWDFIVYEFISIIFLRHVISKDLTVGGVAKIVEQKDPGLTFINGYTKITVIYRACIYETDLQTNRKYFPQLKI